MPGSLLPRCNIHSFQQVAIGGTHSKRLMRLELSTKKNRKTAFSFSLKYGALLFSSQVQILEADYKVSHEFGLELIKVRSEALIKRTLKLKLSNSEAEKFFISLKVEFFIFMVSIDT